MEDEIGTNGGHVNFRTTQQEIPGVKGTIASSHEGGGFYHKENGEINNVKIGTSKEEYTSLNGKLLNTVLEPSHETASESLRNSNNSSSSR